MAFNATSFATKFVPLLDEKYRTESKTSVLDTDSALIKEIDGNKSIKVAKISTDGLADYDRDNGYADGNVTLEWETHTLEFDRGKSFQVDYLDDEESLGLAVANLAGVFLKEKVTPEIDAVRMARYYAKAGTKVTGTLDNTTVCPAIDDAEVVLEEKGVELSSCYLFITPRAYSYVKNAPEFTRTLVPSQNPNKNLGTYDELKIVKIPQDRFVSAIKLTGNGYERGEGAVDINFAVIDSNAVIQTVKHAPLRIFDPQTNQKANAWKIDYRIYHDAWVLDNKTDGIYMHTKASA